MLPSENDPNGTQNPPFSLNLDGENYQNNSRLINIDPNHIDSVDQLRDIVRSLQKQLRETQYELRQKNKEHNEIIRKERLQFTERLDNQGKILDELRCKINDGDMLVQQINSLQEEKTSLLTENNQQKKQLETLVNGNSSSPVSSPISSTRSQSTKIDIIQNMIELSAKIRDSYNDIQNCNNL